MNIEQRNLIEGFKRYNFMLRPDALQLLVERRVDTDQLQLICKGLKKLSLKTQILEAGHIKQVMLLESQGHTESRDINIIRTLQKLKSDAIVILNECFQTSSMPQANQKILMHLRRLEKMRELISLDKRFAKSQQSATADEIQLVSLGSVLGNTGSKRQIITVMGILIQLQSKNFMLSDGNVSMKLQMNHAKLTNIHSNDQPKGVVTLGHVILVSGRWNETESQLEVETVSHPFPQIQQLNIGQFLNVGQLLEADDFGSLSRINKMLDSGTGQQLTMEEQRQQMIFQMEKQRNESFWILSEVDLMSMKTVENFEILFKRSQEFEGLVFPKVIFLIGQFYQSMQEMKKQPEVQKEILGQFFKYQTLLAGTQVFFIPGMRDPPLPNILPHNPIPIQLLFQAEKLPNNFHALSNPVRVDLNDFKIQLFQSDISRELRRNNIFQDLNGVDDICETLWAQRNLGVVGLGQLPLCKWDSASCLQISDSTELLVLADPLLPRFIYESKTFTNKTTVNPGNFSGKGQFVTFSRQGDEYVGYLCEI